MSRQSRCAVTLYFLAYYKHGDAQHVESGPYMSYDEADKARLETYGPVNNWVILETELPLVYSFGEDPDE